MAEAFVDTADWIASFLRADQWHQSALAAQSWLGDASLVTTHEVLAEFLTAVSNYGRKFVLKPPVWCAEFCPIKM